MAKVTIPLLFQDLTGGTRNAEVEGATLADVIASLDRLFPGMASRVLHGDRFNSTVAITVDGRLAAQGPATAVEPKSEVCILPAFGGG